MEYIVHLRGLLRVCGSLADGGEYSIKNGRPTFYTGISDLDVVSVFVYECGTLVERRDYFCTRTSAGQPLRAKKKVVTYF